MRTCAARSRAWGFVDPTIEARFVETAAAPTSTQARGMRAVRGAASTTHLHRFASPRHGLPMTTCFVRRARVTCRQRRLPSRSAMSVPSRFV